MPATFYLYDLLRPYAIDRDGVAGALVTEDGDTLPPEWVTNTTIVNGVLTMTFMVPESYEGSVTVAGIALLGHGEVLELPFVAIQQIAAGDEATVELELAQS